MPADTSQVTRERYGAVLEQSLLGTAWDHLRESGYAEVAVRVARMGLQRPEQESVVEPDDERRAPVAFGLPVLPCSEHATRQGVNTASGYQLVARLR